MNGYVPEIAKGRKRKKVADKVRSFGTYLTDSEGKKIIKMYGSITKAVREKILAEMQ